MTDNSGAPLTGIAAIAAGPASSMAIREDGSVLVWGDTGWPAGID